MKSKKTLRIAMLGLFTAIIILMSFTPLGYLRTAGVEITFLMIPVSVGAVMFGRRDGAILGGIFGLTSLIQCIAGISAFGAMLLSINWLYTILLCIVPRIIMGWLSGLIYELLSKKMKNPLVPCGITCLIAPLINTLLFTGMLVLFFWQTDYIQGFAAGLNILPFIIAFVGINGLLEVLACFIIGTAVARTLLVVRNKLNTTV